jgi:hypothetical protein
MLGESCSIMLRPFWAKTGMLHGETLRRTQLGPCTDALDERSPRTIPVEFMVRKPVFWVDSLYVQRLFRLPSRRRFPGLLGPSLQVGAQCQPGLLAPYDALPCGNRMATV